MIVDFRSDTVTRPTEGMLSAMVSAEVGDDVFGEDPTVNRLESVAAALFGMEAALFCASGTMSNQIAIKAHTQPGDEVICDESAHVYQYEGGGIAFNSGCQVKLLQGYRGRITETAVRGAINPDDVHKSHTRLVCLENTAMLGGGSCYDFREIQKIHSFCAAANVKLHLDGARLFNAMVANGEAAAQYGSVFDSISVCLNKGLGCPIGSMLMGNADFIYRARRIRKILGGGMRQAGYMAACGLYALQHHIERLADDHARARQVAEALSGKPFVDEILPVETNIVIAKLKGDIDAQEIVDKLGQRDVLAIALSPVSIRFVTHLQITPAHIEHAMRVIANS